MIDQRPIFAIPRLAHAGLSVRTIATTLGLSRHTTSTSLDNPNPQPPLLPRPSPLEPFPDAMAGLLASAPTVSAAVRRQRLTAQGCAGGSTMVRDDVRGVRGAPTQPQPVMRFAAAPGEPCQSDWGPCGAMASGDTQRTLSCLAVLACPSRLLSLELTPSQRQETLHRCLLHAWHCFQGPPTALVHDHMRTAVLERQGPFGRFHEPVLEFVRPVHLPPVACQVAQPPEQGKVENGAMHSLRHHCWPLRPLRARTALQAQANPWRDQVATVRVHTTTGQQPRHRFAPTAMRPFPAWVPDCRETAHAKGHTACSLRLDGQTSTVPPWLLGNAITVKADHHHVTGAVQDQTVATHWRGWQRPQRLALPQHRAAAHTHHRRHWDSQEVAAGLA